MNGKNTPVANRPDDLVSRVHLHEKALQTLGGYRGRAAGIDNAGRAFWMLLSLASVPKMWIGKSSPASCMYSMRQMAME